MSARVPIKGSLTFLDSRGTPQIKGIDVGQEHRCASPEPHRGGDPRDGDLALRARPRPVRPRGPAAPDRRIPVEQLLKPGTIEDLENRAMLLEHGSSTPSASRRRPGTSTADEGQGLPAGDRPRPRGAAAGDRRLRQKLQAEAVDLDAKADAAEKAGKPREADVAPPRGRRLHSPPSRSR